MGIRRTLISRKKLKQQWRLRTATIIVCLSMLFTEGIFGTESSGLRPWLLSTLYFMNPTPAEKPLARSRQRQPTDTHRETKSELSFGRWRGRLLDDPPSTSSFEDSASSSQKEPLQGPPPPKELPLRFLRAAKNDVEEGWRRFQATLQWRRDEGVDTILREPNPHFDLIQKNYVHYFHGKGYNGEPVFYEIPSKLNLKAMRQGGLTMQAMIRYYVQLAEFQWQYVNRDDNSSSIVVVDLEGIRLKYLKNFVGEGRDFIFGVSDLAEAHYPGRPGKTILLNPPGWFHLIWRVLRPFVPESAVENIFVLRGNDEVRQKLQEYIPLENIPREYGGKSPIPLGEAPEEKLLKELMKHNNLLAEQKQAVCSGCANHLNTEDWPCQFCRWTPARSY